MLQDIKFPDDLEVALNYRPKDYFESSNLGDQAHSRLGYMEKQYLPNLRINEVEVARITLDSVTQDMMVVDVRKAGNRLHYRFVHEYYREDPDSIKTRTSSKPLSMREMIIFFLKSSNLLEELGSDFENNTEVILNFFRGDSFFYPKFDDILKHIVQQKFSAL